MDLRDPEYSAKVRQSLAASFCHKTAIRSNRGDGIYRTVHENYPVAVEPDSCLINMSWEWVIYDRIYYAVTQYMNCVTVINPEWIMDLQYYQDHNFARKFDGVTLRNPDVKASLDRARAERGSQSALRHPSFEERRTLRHSYLKNNDMLYGIHLLIGNALSGTPFLNSDRLYGILTL
ncbi:hypothetical protein N0V84_004077 [Fusarium piperis]|uniref:DEAD-box helicase OB fold domain-containing protein n=1 Tax=Fusarium piperis TaxID=1435070 RepID=A0A9W8WG78_9HYPO|nr:hypothetical protein N0V84_004077 [Fusarium piperis]